MKTALNTFSLEQVPHIMVVTSLNPGGAAYKQQSMQVDAQQRYTSLQLQGTA